MEVLKVEISHSDGTVLHAHAEPLVLADGANPGQVEHRREFMGQTIEALRKLKEASDATLTQLIESKKTEGTKLQKLQSGEPSKRVKQDADEGLD